MTDSSGWFQVQGEELIDSPALLVHEERMEENLRRAMRISSGDPMIFINRPISLGLLIAATILLLIVALPAIRGKREEVFQEG